MLTHPPIRSDLLAANATDNVTNLSRFQGAVSLNRSFLLWSAPTLPPTPDQGLRFSPRSRSTLYCSCHWCHRCHQLLH
jgi:hypothetical protein